MTSVTSIMPELCIGCGACIVECPVDAIAMRADQEGFYRPCVNAEKCLNCGECLQVCIANGSVQTDSYPMRKNTYACFALDSKVHTSSTSGGIATVLSKWTLRNGGVVYGVRYAENFRKAVYARVTTEQELAALQGSKYFQSVPPDYLAVRADLDCGNAVLFVGLPCQTAALQAWLGLPYDNLIMVSLICNGVTSERVQSEYIDYLEKKYRGQVTCYVARDKKESWSIRYSTAVINDSRTEKFAFDCSSFDFAYETLKRKSCYRCPFKLDRKNRADMVIGDFWGCEDKDIYDRMGVSAVILQSEKAVRVFDAVKDALRYENCVADDIAKHNGALYQCPSDMLRKKYSALMETTPIEKRRRQILGAGVIMASALKQAIKRRIPDAVSRKIRIIKYKRK